jgi:hypothetical protein
MLRYVKILWVICNKNFLYFLLLISFLIHFYILFLDVFVSERYWVGSMFHNNNLPDIILSSFRNKATDKVIPGSFIFTSFISPLFQYKERYQHWCWLYHNVCYQPVTLLWVQNHSKRFYLWISYVVLMTTYVLQSSQRVKLVWHILRIGYPHIVEMSLSVKWRNQFSIKFGIGVYIKACVTYLIFSRTEPIHLVT